MRTQLRGRLTPNLLVLLALTTAACGAGRPTVAPVQNARGADDGSLCPVYVLEGLSGAHAFQGNSLGTAEAAIAVVAGRAFDVVLERCPLGKIVRLGPSFTYRPRATPAIAGGEALPAAVLRAAVEASREGAQSLLVPTIVQWKEMRTDDPIGTFILPHNSVIVDLVFIDLGDARVVGSASFSNRAHLTLNQPAQRLVNERYSSTVRGLLDFHG